MAKSKLVPLHVNDPVQRNHPDNQETGRVTRLAARSSHNVEVRWDSGEGPFYYTYNLKEQEVIKINGSSK